VETIKLLAASARFKINLSQATVGKKFLAI
jgi:hypothetical protein